MREGEHEAASEPLYWLRTVALPHRANTLPLCVVRHPAAAVLTPPRSKFAFEYRNLPMQFHAMATVPDPRMRYEAAPRSIPCPHRSQQEEQSLSFDALDPSRLALYVGCPEQSDRPTYTSRKVVAWWN